MRPNILVLVLVSKVSAWGRAKIETTHSTQICGSEEMLSFIIVGGGEGWRLRNFWAQSDCVPTLYDQSCKAVILEYPQAAEK